MRHNGYIKQRALGAKEINQMNTTYEISYFNQIGEFVISEITTSQILTVVELNQMEGFVDCSVLSVEPIIS